MKNAVVLACDDSYMDKLETTIKSICAHNKNIKFYILNEDLPIEWFRLMTKRLSYFNSEILNIKVSGDSFKKFRCPSEHINYQAYFRYLIPDYVSEEKVLYLDCDIIVTESLDGLFNLDLKNYPVAAVPDLPTTNDGFNSGVLLINNKYWKENDILNRLIKLTVEYHEKVYGDQGILNILFKDKWYSLSLTYNLQVGSDSQEFKLGNDSWYTLFDGMPKVIHYSYVYKPWLIYNRTRFKDIWWFYYGISWDKIILGETRVYDNFNNLIDVPKYNAVTYTNTQDLHEIETLVKSLPNVNFHILAHTLFGPRVVSLEKYMNVSLYPEFNLFKETEVLNTMDIYLDVNYEGEVDYIINRVHKAGKPVYSFECTNHDNSGLNKIYKDDDVDNMIKDINEYIQNL